MARTNEERIRELELRMGIEELSPEECLERIERELGIEHDPLEEMQLEERIARAEEGAAQLEERLERLEREVEHARRQVEERLLPSLLSLTNYQADHIESLVARLQQREAEGKT